jgi:hypothetical protein
LRIVGWIVVTRARRTLGLLSRQPIRLGGLFLAGLLAATSAGAICPGDCDGSGDVGISELVKGVNIALGSSPLTDCPAFNTNGDDMVSVSELVAAVNAALNSCPPESPTATVAATSTASPPPTITATPTATPTATQTSTDTPTATPTVTATINQAPVLPTASIYRTYPGLPISLPIGAVDPEGSPVRCAVQNLPAGAAFDEQSNVLSWTPADDQLGPFYLPFTCMDDATPPGASDGQLTFKVSALDSCAMPSCDPATGCTSTLPPVGQTCCASGPAARVAEPVAGCPEGRVLYIGQSASIDGFGRIQNCDVLVIKNMEQSSAELQFHVQTRCLNTLVNVRMHARLESNSARHPLVFDVEAAPFLLAQLDDGWAIRRARRFSIPNPPYVDMQGAEANLTVTMTDSANVSVTESVRVRLSFTPHPDLPDLDPTPLPTATRTATPGGG